MRSEIVSELGWRFGKLAAWAVDRPAANRSGTPTSGGPSRVNRTSEKYRAASRRSENLTTDEHGWTRIDLMSQAVTISEKARLIQR